MTTKPRPMTIRRQTLAGKSHGWLVTCSRCPDESKPLFLQPLLRADRWADALWWANWHAAEHDRTHCHCCDRPRAVPRITVLDSNTVKVGTRVFIRDGRPGRDTWMELAA